MKKELKKLNKLLNVDQPLPKDKLIDELCDEIGNWDDELLLESAQMWRRSLLEKQSVKYLRELHKEEITDAAKLDNE